MPATLIMAFLCTLPAAAAAASLAASEMAANHCMYKSALELLDEAPKFERESPAGVMLRSRLLIQLHRGDEAAAILDKMSNRDGRSEADRLLALGLALGEANRIGKAEQTLQRAQSAGADKVLVAGAVATLRLQEGKLVEAERMMREVLRQEPLLSGILYNLAVLRTRQGYIAEAAALIRQSWHAGLQDPGQLKSDPDLRELRKAKGLIDDLLAFPIPRCDTY